MPQGPFGLLVSAVGYTVVAVREVTPQMMRGPTPCTEWDLRTLLHHLNDALDVIAQGLDDGRIDLDRRDDVIALNQNDPAATFLSRAGPLLAACRSGGHRRAITIAGHLLPLSVVAATVAIEIAVHGWDVSQASGHARPIPAALALALLAICPSLVTNATRRPLFGRPVSVSPEASPSDQIVAFLGRTPTADVIVKHDIPSRS